eukprot:TRINITY_DN30718_c0_g1_i1.p4 TRINITY_DN30718_c0_g1~~TRINITY_DN30718_c0_g1_i1.p4  ORF type:complete len:142 (-),score=17.17 TRINITY_DN30718_c0_g1_i1:172-597(-)
MLFARPSVETIEKIAEIKAKDQAFTIRHWKTNKPHFLISKRDFLICGTSLKNSDGSYYTICTSVMPELYQKKDYVRGEIIFSVNHIVPIENNMKSQVTQVQLNDSKGQLPVFILNLAAKEAATVIKKFNQYLEKTDPKPKL